MHQALVDSQAEPAACAPSRSRYRRHQGLPSTGRSVVVPPPRHARRAGARGGSHTRDESAKPTWARVSSRPPGCRRTGAGATVGVGPGPDPMPRKKPTQAPVPRRNGGGPRGRGPLAAGASLARAVHRPLRVARCSRRPAGISPPSSLGPARSLPRGLPGSRSSSEHCRCLADLFQLGCNRIHAMNQRFCSSQGLEQGISQ